MANQLAGFGPLAAMGYVQQQGDIGRQRGQQERINMLAGQSYSATTPEQQSSLLSQLAQVDPQAAQDQQQQFQSQEDRSRKELYGMAQGWKKVPQQYRQGYYEKYLSPRLAAMGMGEQPAYDEATINGAADQIIAAFGQPMVGRNENKVVGGALVDPNGNVIYESPANGQIVNVPAGNNDTQQMIFDPRTRQLSPLPSVGGGALGAAASPAATVFRDQNGEIIDMSKVTEPGLRESIMQNPEQWGLVPDGGSVQLPDRNVAQFSPPAQRLGYTPPKREASFVTLSPEEVAAIGLPVGTIAQRNPNGQVSIVNKPRDLPTGGQVIDNGDGTTTYIPAGKISEGERNASGFYQRMVSANDEMRRLEESGYDPTNRRDYYTAGGEFLNPLATPEGQQYRQAQDNWLRANLRKESGAAIGVAEMDQERKNYFPIPGDSPQVIQQKMRNRTVTERAMRSAAGGGLPPVDGSSAGRGNTVQRERSNTAPPRAQQGVDFSNLWN
ncbi:hypothetical protein [Stenotrophomonas sp.]|uniref:hypothetical protein n=1 Tax=Stenotrophomonas sp. TaxID=69392 RepID=UPI002896C265|nr:hypothetical protein [Stenotrophomonas sp.]